MADETRNISVVVRASNAIRDLTNVGLSLEKMGSAVGKSDRELAAMDRALNRTSRVTNEAATALFKARAELRRLGTEATVSRGAITSLENKLGTANKRIAEQRVKIDELRKANSTLAKDNERLAASYDKVAVSQAKATNQTTKAVQDSKNVLEDLNKGFHENALRYALYDVANSFSIMRDAGVAAYTDLISTGIEFERNFANVVRTSQVSNPSLFADTAGATKLLRDQFLDLQSTLPVTSEELTRIGTLAAQMGIAASEVAAFTETTAKFAAASGIGADEAATALARISQLLVDDVRGDFDKLASAILKTGVNAIATEQQIVRGTTQIASIGKVAGLSAVEIIALSSAMSSLGMSPELQRSVITSSFTKILTAVRGSADEAARFGQVLGMTGEEFQTAWEGDGYNTYRKLLATIADSPQAITILQDLGLASQRLTPNLLKMGQAYQLFGETLADTTQGAEERNELDRQYQIIMDTTAAKLQVLSQAWDAFLTIIGQDAVTGLGDIFEKLTGGINALRAAMSNPLTASIVKVILFLGLLATGVLALLTAFTLGGAAILGFRYVIAQLQVAFPSLQASMAATGLQTVTFTGQTRAATLAARAFGVALKAASVVGLLLIAPDLIQGLTGFIDAVSGADKSIDALTSKVSAGIGLGPSISDLKGFGYIKNMGAGWTDVIRGTGDWSTGFLKDVTDLDHKLRDMANAGEAEKAAAQLKVLRDQFLDAGGTDDTFNSLFTDTYGSLKLVANQTSATAEELDTYYTALDSVANEEAEMAIQTAAAANALGLMANNAQTAEDALASYVDAVKSGGGSLFDVPSMLSNAYGTDEGQGGGLARFQQDLDAGLVATQKWADGIQELSFRGAGSLATAFAAEGPAAQQAITDALALGPEGLAQLENSMADAAFFASDAFANAFAADNAKLADVYKKALQINPDQALEAVHAFRDALTAGGGVIDESTLAGLEAQFGFDVNLDLLPTIDPAALELEKASLRANPILIPVKPTLGDTALAGDAAGLLATQVSAWQLEMDGHTLILPVDPNTDEGKLLIQEWRDSEYQTPLTIQTWADTVGADLALENWRIMQANRIVTIQIRANMPDLNGDVSGTGRYGTIATGGLIHNRKIIRQNYPAFARGTILRGRGTGTSDSIIARVSNGEAITKAAAVRYYGTSMMDDINHMRFPRYATGMTPAGFSGTGSSGQGQQVNVNVVQNYPTTRDPIKTMKQDAESVVAGIWT